MKNTIMAGVPILIAHTSRGRDEVRTWEKARQRLVRVLDSLVETPNRGGENGLVLPVSVTYNPHTRSFLWRSGLIRQDASPERARYRVARVISTHDLDEEEPDRSRNSDSPRYRCRTSSDARPVRYTARAGRATFDPRAQTDSARPPGSTVTLSPEGATQP